MASNERTKKTQRTQLLVFGQYKRANKQHIQSSKNIKKVDQEGTIEFSTIVKTQQVMRQLTQLRQRDKILCTSLSKLL